MFVRFAGILLVIGFCTALPGLAGDVAQLQILGFSPDGRYLAYEVSGVQDGSGSPYCEIYFIDVVRNEYAASPVRLRGRESESRQLAGLRQQAALSAAPSLQSLSIAAAVKGKALVHHPLTDLTSDGCYVKFSTFPGPPPGPGGSIYELVLEERPAGKSCFDLEAKIFTLRLQQGARTRILQHDTRLPASRGCVFRYRIERVIAYEQKIAVFLNTFLPGFEGPDVRYMVVTGELTFADTKKRGGSDE